MRAEEVRKWHFNVRKTFSNLFFVLIYQKKGLPIYYNVGKSVSTDRPPDHPDGRLDWIQKRGTNLSPSPARTAAGPGHQTPLYNQSPGQTQITQRLTSEAGRCRLAVPSLLTRVPRSTA